ncbi:hypothetical protein AB0B25_24895 [Nocardia sp. NPDC049190]|uniref:hypothetical protein n=1 Tax=Nocardia sp. NPDC049190 TaxID=3155650 RepID=UPI0033EB0B26
MSTRMIKRTIPVCNLFVPSFHRGVVDTPGSFNHGPEFTNGPTMSDGRVPGNTAIGGLAELGYKAAVGGEEISTADSRRAQ